MKRIMTLLTVLIAGSGMLKAQNGLDDCIEAARRNYPLAAQYELIDKSAEYSFKNAAASWYPQIALSGQATIQNRAVAFPGSMTEIYKNMGIDMQGIEKDQYKIAMDISQNIWDGGRSKADRDKARSSAEEQARSIDVDMYALEQRVADIYFGVLLMERQKDQLDVNRTLIDENLKTLRASVRRGAALEADAMALEAELLSLNQKYTELETAQKSYCTMLEAFTGYAPDPSRMSAPAINLDPGMPGAGEMRPEFRLFEAKESTLNASESLLNSSLSPNLALFAQGWYGYPGLNMFDNMMSPDWSWNVLAGVRLTWNIGSLYTYGNSKKQIDIARSQIAVQKDVFNFNRKLEETSRSAEIEKLERLIADDERIVQLRTSVRKNAESKLSGGSISTTEFLSILSEEQKALSAHSLHKIQLAKAHYDLMHTIR